MILQFFFQNIEKRIQYLYDILVQQYLYSWALQKKHIIPKYILRISELFRSSVKKLLNTNYLSVCLEYCRVRVWYNMNHALTNMLYSSTLYSWALQKKYIPKYIYQNYFSQLFKNMLNTNVSFFLIFILNIAVSAHDMIMNHERGTSSWDGTGKRGSRRRTLPRLPRRAWTRSGFPWATGCTNLTGRMSAAQTAPWTRWTACSTCVSGEALVRLSISISTGPLPQKKNLQRYGWNWNSTFVERLSAGQAKTSSAWDCATAVI